MRSLVLSIPSCWPIRPSNGITPARNGGKSMLQLYPDYQGIGVFRGIHLLNLEGKFSNGRFFSENCLGKERSKLCRVAVFRAVSSKAWVAREVSDSGSATLYQRISRLGVQETSAVEVLQEWLGEGRRVRKFQLQRIIKELRKYRKYKHALEISEWICNNENFRLTSGDYAVCLDLIAKVHGIVSAEKYFAKLPETAKNRPTYGALLNAYVNENLTEKAEAVMEKLKRFGFANNALPFNAMMNLYVNTGQLGKVPLVIQEMKEKGVPLDTFSYNIWITTCAAISDIDKMEQILDEVKGNDTVNTNWTIYSTLATMYIKASLVDKAESALQEVEDKMPKNDRDPYNYLISLYASAGNKEGVYRIWQSFKLAFPKMTNKSYICMISSLVKIGDIEGAEKFFKEWESACFTYDVRVSNILLGAYVRMRLLEKAELLLEHIVESGGKPNVNTWEILAEGYIQNGQFDKAVAAMKNSSSVANYVPWQPKSENVLSVLKHFEKQGDVESAEDYFKVLRGANYVSTEIYNSLLRTYIQAGKAAPRIFEQMKNDKVNPNEETDILLKQAPEPR